MAEPAGTNTTGSVVLLPVSEHLGFPLDQVNFVVCQLLGLTAAFWFRLHLRPSRFSPLARHAVATAFGVAILIFCFGWYSAHVLVLVTACYLIMVFADVNNVHKYSLVAAMGYLTACQVCRAYIFSYAVPSTDFSGLALRSPPPAASRRLLFGTFDLRIGARGSVFPLFVFYQRVSTLLWTPSVPDAEVGHDPACRANCQIHTGTKAPSPPDDSRPLMIVTQKITTLAFQLHDGKAAERRTHTHTHTRAL
ncbi:unnamed protein product [Tetraodon nigroviridis]|uniref:(spotted green pufferfish) hypothetical protein n=1 Tax=Tetraodon nigroviridis TaxID=99883 RepID=Q4SH94_TETNG|nr:unnamed protein product [Tetraodon nigroviridis]